MSVDPLPSYPSFPSAASLPPLSSAVLPPESPS